MRNDPDLPGPAYVTALNNTLGGDSEAIARFLGLTGPNGTCFCDFCEVELKDVQKGIPHAPIIFPRYSLHCDKVNYNYKERTFEDLRLLTHVGLFRQNGLILSEVVLYMERSKNHEKNYIITVQKKFTFLRRFDRKNTVFAISRNLIDKLVF